MFTKSSLDDALNNLNCKELLEDQKLKEQSKLFEQNDKENHPTIIQIGGHVSKKIYMGDYTIVLATEPVAPPMCPEINEHPMQYLFSKEKRKLISHELTFSN